MVKKAILSLILISAALSANTQSGGPRIQDFRLPSYKIFGLWLLTGLNNGYYSEDMSYNADIRPYYQQVSDTTEIALLFGVRVDHFYSWAVNCYNSAEIRHYPFSLPLFLHGELSNNVFAQSTDWEPQLWSDFEIGTGLGRLREGLHVARALYINDMLVKDGIIDDDLTEETILRIAQALAKEGFYGIKYDRRLKYLFQEIEEVLTSDPACNKSIPAFTWFKIYSIGWAIPRYGGQDEHEFGRRVFGSRVSIDFLADKIHTEYMEYGYRRLEFPVSDHYYYNPGIRIKYEYGKPIDLRRQLTFASSYVATLYDEAVFHRVDIQPRYGYGITDLILIEGIVSIYYDLRVPQDTISQSIFGIMPVVEFNYYIENGITVGLDGGCDFRREESQLITSGYDYTANWFVMFNTRWRVF